MFEKNGTIAAISTPVGSGGIAVIRVSGSTAIDLVSGIFRSKKPLQRVESHRVIVGRIVDTQTDKQTALSDVLDEVVVTLFRAPNSYTKEDVVEISCHGGHFLSHRILDLLLEKGARLAQPGEFTERAFMNGRIDLCQAEAVADIIAAKTEFSLKSALRQFQGALSERIRKIRGGLIEVYSLLELELDFAEEDVQFANKEDLERSLDAVIGECKSFLETYKKGRIIREGAKLVIVGKPNVGKSSLLNALLKQDRAIVTEIPGTTRDVLEEQLDINGVYFRVVDTAGIRDTNDEIEKLGVERTVAQVKEADIVLLLFDGSEKLDQQDRQLIDEVKSLMDGSASSHLIAAINKIDLDLKITPQEIESELVCQSVQQISAKKLTGMNELEESLVKVTLGKDGVDANEAMVTNFRQKQALKLALERLQSAQKSLQDGLSSEFVSLDLRESTQHLGEIIGEVTTEDILDNIFLNFCIGK